MIEFKESDPFPLIKADSYTYQGAKDHAILVDDWLGFEHEKIESSLRGGDKSASSSQQNWEHLSVQAMQTPYVEIRNILDILNPQPGETLIDLGAAYGRMGLVMNKHFPLTNFFGFEIEAARVREAQRVMALQKMDISQMITADLSSPEFTMPVADYYFIFDYGHERDVRRTLQDLQSIARTRPLHVVARGRLSRALIHAYHPWLASMHGPQHFPHFSIYRS